MAEIRETHIERDAEGRVVDRKESIQVERPRRGGRFGWGMLLGIILVAGAIAVFAYNQGSFQSAGREADQATALVEEQLDESGVASPAIQRDEAALPKSDTVSN